MGYHIKVYFNFFGLKLFPKYIGKNGMVTDVKDAIIFEDKKPDFSYKTQEVMSKMGIGSIEGIK